MIYQKNINSFRLLVVIPCLNEEKHIRHIVLEIANQCKGLDASIAVVDGGSTDGTREILDEMLNEVDNLIFIENRKRIQSAAVNLAVSTLGEDADYIIRVDAHGAYPSNYCSALLHEAIEMSTDSVVVGMKTIGFRSFQIATALAQSSKLGNGGSKHREGAGGGWVDHGHHALMSVKAFREVGGYDEKFTHNEDAELDYRLRKAGYRIWMTGKTHMTYYPRSSVISLYRQYFAYGRGRARNMLKHKSIPKARQSIPLAVLPAALFAVLTPFFPLAAVPLLVWGGACLSYGLWMLILQRNKYGALAAISAMVMHFAWSGGFWTEVLHNRFKRDSFENR